MTDFEEPQDEMNWYAPDAATFGDRVAAAREAAGMTQSALARRLGVRASTLSAWENDMSEPRANRLSMLAGILNVSMMWLINGEGEGLDGPVESAVLIESADDILTEMRDLRLQMVQNTTRLAQLEKRLRSLFLETPND